MKKTFSPRGSSRILLTSVLVAISAFSMTSCKDKDTSKAAVQKTETLAHGITLATVEANASGKTQQEALQNALILAVEQVNGVRVAHSLDVNSVIADYNASHSEKMQTSAHYDESANGRMAMHASGPDGTADGTLSASSHGNGHVSADYRGNSSESGHGDLNTRTEQKSSTSSGIIHSFKILNQVQNDGLWQVKISAKIAKYSASAISKRLKIAVLPFRKANGAATSGYENSVRDRLINILSGAGKVAVLDRDYSQENIAEMAQLGSDAFNKNEAVKLGQRLGADYILVGTVKAAVHTNSVYIQALGQRVSGDSQARAMISYRLIEAATGIVQMSGILNEAAASSHLEGLADKDARTISDHILNTLYPVQVVSISNGVFYLNRGGDSIHVGNHFRVMKQGQPLKDPDTGEVIGATENEVARITVSEVDPKVSKAVLAGNGAVPALNGNKMIARPYEVEEKTPVADRAAPKVHKVAHKTKNTTPSGATEGVDF